MLRRVPEVGEPIVPLADDYPKTVGFLLPEKDAPPIGTGFIVNYFSEVDETTRFRYLVTAQHVAEKATIFRANRDWRPAHISGARQGVEELPIKWWIHHKVADVSIALLPDEIEIRTKGIPGHMFLDLGFGPRYFYRGDTLRLDYELRGPLLGDRIYFIGLFRSMETMADKNVPLMRSGTLAATYEPKVPIKYLDETTGFYEGQSHLVDCRLLKGFSGAPCFIQHEELVNGELNRYTRLLGVMGANFDIEVLDPVWPKGRKDDDPPFEMQRSASEGVGVVIPADYIRELLQQEDVMEDRRKRTKKKKPDNPGVAKLMSDDDTESFDRFEKLAKKVVSVPKDEVKKRG